jgi:SAM-dependent methyltransferase
MAEVAQDWQAARYERHARFVAELGLPVVELLAPQAGERILDLGCGDGALTLRLAEFGCRVVGVDAAPDMVRSARERGVDARLVDGHALVFERCFDAVLSNAALHWMRRDPAAVAAGVARALVPGGRFVGEMGGHGNVAAIVTALIAVLEARGLDGASAIPWYFPTPEEYREVLEGAGFAVERIELIPRPTPLPTDLGGWLATFAEPFLGRLPEASLCDRRGRWTADYVRLRFLARLPV